MASAASEGRSDGDLQTVRSCDWFYDVEFERVGYTMSGCVLTPGSARAPYGMDLCPFSW
ncbi:uncharacterized protein LAESUDRAFT_730961 [Laetiporus sulphureus 93-53]|uniref:Uncharacterized protein n=1 Tax=Laetiporus sulphureus 93-53 TaxID=1314785 RepID=A0A165BUP2_9APHY|nr:uncharacterized protein LAESUDRAFT_730961 [Laetiporus sulphureus 93-53]KZT01689.1 hypothetical protein LAESUDRAFT_730961 [Laetiporus sulphureus 93-53]